MKQTGTMQTYGSSQTTCIHPRVIVSAVIPLKRAFRGGSKSLRVDVHGKRRGTMLRSSWYLVIVVVQGL